MTKLELMQYMWPRGMRYQEIDHYAKLSNCTDIPTLEEFEAYCTKEQEAMEAYFRTPYDERNY